MRLRQEYVQQVHQMVTPTTKSRSAIVLRNARRTISASMGSITAQLRLVYSSITAQLRLVYNSLTVHLFSCVCSSFAACLQRVYMSPCAFTPHLQFVYSSFTAHPLNLQCCTYRLQLMFNLLTAHSHLTFCIYYSTARSHQGCQSSPRGAGMMAEICPIPLSPCFPLLPIPLPFSIPRGPGTRREATG